jgi:hypothetical protein
MCPLPILIIHLNHSSQVADLGKSSQNLSVAVDACVHATFGLAWSFLRCFMMVSLGKGEAPKENVLMKTFVKT